MRNPLLLVVASLVLAAGIIAGALLIRGGDADAGASSGPRTLANGETATVEQETYLQAVEPHLSDQAAADTLAVLSAGQSVCTVWLHPEDSQQQAIAQLMSASGYNQTEATAIAQAASDHLCPGK